MCLCLNSDKHHFMVFRRLKKTKTCKCDFRVITTKEARGPAIQIAQPQPVPSGKLAQVGRPVRNSQGCLVSCPGTWDVLECNCFVSEAHLCVPLPLALIHHLLYSNSAPTRPSGPAEDAKGCEWMHFLISDMSLYLLIKMPITSIPSAITWTLMHFPSSVRAFLFISIKAALIAKCKSLGGRRAFSRGLRYFSATSLGEGRHHYAVVFYSLPRPEPQSLGYTSLCLF